ncbi:hypothetical protein [Paraburkholderia sp. J67]|uniref:hypothetical protein n=1 Tax=Paraburkholderia sp. J67 TaxID=2805435 RepID=UPI002ABD7B2C|nr:hypothetical protein [Paraburkholderia sp. J67]
MSAGRHTGSPTRSLSNLLSSYSSPFPRLIASLFAAATVLSACASASDVTATDKDGIYSVSASASGGRLAWARAHRRALAEANDYCATRGMQTSFAAEQRQGVEPLAEQDTVLRFECHPVF